MIFTHVDSIRQTFDSNQVVVVPSFDKVFVSKVLGSLGSIDSSFTIYGLSNWKDFDNLDIKMADDYDRENFVKILDSDKLLSTNDVINTNNCFITVCKTKYKNKIIIISAIDNLIKGAAGQAVQCFNIAENIEETVSLL